jgi:ABC-type transport system involved in cytochrome c biogenesis permease subunit
MESISRLGVGNVVAGAAGFSTLLIGYFLAGDGDTFKVLVAVLDTQFWLATHVTTINLGYSTTFLAGMFGVMYVALGSPPRFLYSAAALVGLSAWALPAPIAGSIESFTDITLAPELIRGCGIAIGLLGLGLTAWYSDRIAQAANSPITTERREELSRMVYGTLCFGILFSFFGTVLGGLWADDSWGRFWGWDPKENGALIIVLWNAVVLHARWGGMVKDRGLAVLSIGGNIATGWSWFGVNELGVGKHSYGFTEGVLLALGLFVLSQLVVIIIGCLPKDLAGDARKNDGLASR